MEQVRDKAGVATIIALLAIFIALYSLWGADLLRSQQQASAQGSANSVATNL